MISRDEILVIVIGAVQSLNDELIDEEKLEVVNEQTLLFGSGATLDSLSLVSVIVDVETEISDYTGHHITLTDDRAMSQDISPFDSVRTLCDYICLLTKELE